MRERSRPPRAVDPVATTPLFACAIRKAREESRPHLRCEPLIRIATERVMPALNYRPGKLNFAIGRRCESASPSPSRNYDTVDTVAFATLLLVWNNCEISTGGHPPGRRGCRPRCTLAAGLNIWRRQCTPGRGGSRYVRGWWGCAVGDGFGTPSFAVYPTALIACLFTRDPMF